jgi:hypothetical protein
MMAGDAWRVAGLVADREVADIAREATRGAADDVDRNMIFVGVGVS